MLSEDPSSKGVFLFPAPTIISTMHWVVRATEVYSCVSSGAQRLGADTIGSV